MTISSAATRSAQPLPSPTSGMPAKSIVSPEPKMSGLPDWSKIKRDDEKPAAKSLNLGVVAGVVGGVGVVAGAAAKFLGHASLGRSAVIGGAVAAAAAGVMLMTGCSTTPETSVDPNSITRLNREISRGFTHNASRNEALLIATRSGRSNSDIGAMIRGISGSVSDDNSRIDILRLGAASNRSGADIATIAQSAGRNFTHNATRKAAVQDVLETTVPTPKAIEMLTAAGQNYSTDTSRLSALRTMLGIASPEPTYPDGGVSAGDE